MSCWVFRFSCRHLVVCFPFFLGPKTLCTLFSPFFREKGERNFFSAPLHTRAFFSSLFCGFSPPSLPSLAAFSGELKKAGEREREKEKSEEEAPLFSFPSFLLLKQGHFRAQERRLRLSVANFSSYLCPKSRQFPPPFRSLPSQLLMLGGEGDPPISSMR